MQPERIGGSESESPRIHEITVLGYWDLWRIVLRSAKYHATPYGFESDADRRLTVLKVGGRTAAVTMAGSCDIGDT